MAARSTSHAVIALGANVGDITTSFARAIAELPLRGVQVRLEDDISIHMAARLLLSYALHVPIGLLTCHLSGDIGYPESACIASSCGWSSTIGPG
jgi:hypothetical protein